MDVTVNWSALLMKKLFVFFLMTMPMFAGALSSMIPTGVFARVANYPTLDMFGSWVWIIVTSIL